MNFAHAEVATLDPTTMRTLCEEYMANNYIDPETSERLGVKRGLRNADGTGVVAGITSISNVHGYLTDEGVAHRSTATWHFRCQTLAPGALFNHVSVMAVCHLITTRAIERAGAAGRTRLRGIERFGDTLEEL